MTCRIHYQVNEDAVYLVMYHEDHERNRYFFGGEGIVAPRGEPVPVEARHKLTSIQAIELLDALLAEGYRPSNNSWSAGHVSDLKAHIAFAERMATALLPKPDTQFPAHGWAENKNG